MLTDSVLVLCVSLCVCVCVCVSAALACPQRYIEGERPRIQNDTIIMGHNLSRNSIVKMGIVYPLAQSTKLKIYESRIQSEVDRFIALPRTLATTGTVELSKKEIHQLIGTVFLEKCAVNLLTTGRRCDRSPSRPVTPLAQLIRIQSNGMQCPLYLFPAKPLDQPRDSFD